MGGSQQKILYERCELRMHTQRPLRVPRTSQSARTVYVTHYQDNTTETRLFSCDAWMPLPYKLPCNVSPTFPSQSTQAVSCLSHASKIPVGRYPAGPRVLENSVMQLSVMQVSAINGNKYLRKLAYKLQVVLNSIFH